MRWTRSSAHFHIHLPSLYVQETLKMILTCKDMRALKNISAHSILESQFRVTSISFWILEWKTDICMKYIILNDTAARGAQLIKTALDQKDPKKGLGFPECSWGCGSWYDNSCSNILSELLEIWLFTLVSKGALRACLRERDPRL